MTYLLEFQKINPTSSHDTVSYQSVIEINNQVFKIYIEKNPWKPSKYLVSFYHNGKKSNLYANYSSAKKAIIDCQIHVNHLIQKTN